MLETEESVSNLTDSKFSDASIKNTPTQNYILNTTKQLQK